MAKKPHIIEMHIKINALSRPGFKLPKLLGVIIHWTANFGATAKNHYDFFNKNNTRYAGAHVFIDKTGIYILVPLNEVTYHANESACRVAKLKFGQVIGGKYRQWDANLTTIGVEECVEKDGTIHPETRKNTEEFMAYILSENNLSVKDIYRHHDITGKNCPAYFVGSKNDSAYTQFKNNIQAKMQGEVEVKVPIVTAPTTSTGTTYKVVKGDSLSKIATNHKVTVAELKSWNDLKSDLIQIGQILMVSKPKTTTTTNTTTTSTTAKVIREYTLKSTTTYKVVKGDSLSKIATKYKTTVAELKSLNNLKSDLIHIGQNLIVGNKSPIVTVNSKDGLNLRSDATPNAKVIQTLNDKTTWKSTGKVKVLSDGNEWIQIGNGWANKHYVKVSY